MFSITRFFNKIFKKSTHFNAEQIIKIESCFGRNNIDMYSLENFYLENIEETKIEYDLTIHRQIVLFHADLKKLIFEYEIEAKIFYENVIELTHYVYINRLVGSKHKHLANIDSIIVEMVCDFYTSTPQIQKRNILFRKSPEIGFFKRIFLLQIFFFLFEEFLRVFVAFFYICFSYF